MRYGRITLAVALGAATFGPASASAQEPEQGAQEFAAQPAPALDPAALDVERADTFSVRVQGQHIGSQVLRVLATEDGFAFVEATTTPVATQTTEVHMGPDLSLRSVAQRGQSEEQAVRIEVAYADGRGTGRTITSTRGETTESALDFEVPAHAIDDNAFITLLAALPWTAESRWTLPLVASGRGVVVPMELAVAGTETVTVPAGSFEAYRIEMSGGEQPLLVYISTARPHRVVKMGLAEAPFELVLTGP